MPMYIIIKPLKAKDRENILKATGGNSHPTCRGKQLEQAQIFHQKSQRPKESTTGFFEC